ncbi:hypothetical protein [Erythrobacter crassostreae]|uniref:Uncharacterized protein n=1 Tax=Erythrobacter crassostreae TaxID=2828328 RepID=A0A9X1F3S8_9SPHN|nr:hypothetical protein [Erythrobacter crassostrea]MBV7258973.1 hypothetical protein [Erythrobacter crassostrea]
MARQFSRSYTSGHDVRADGSVAFDCSQDTDAWPWLTLGPRHPITIQAQNFWTSVGAIMALGGMEEGQWSALTWTEWTCGSMDAGMATRGLYKRETSGDGEHYAVTLYDKDDRIIADMRGRGVVFRNRNFEEWRGKAKSQAQSQSVKHSIEFAQRARLGIGPQEHALVSSLQVEDNQYVDALITPENGLPPANPMLGGSGDHVNSVHMIEVARQALCLLTDDPNVAVTGGEMELNRYVELGTPFRLDVREHGEVETVLTLNQLGKACAKLTLRR